MHKNKHKPVYKKTKVGWIPVDWSSTYIDNVCDKISVGIVIRPARLYCDAGIPCFRSANIGEGEVRGKDWVYISEAANRANAKSQLQEGDILIVRTGAPGTACLVPAAYSGSNCVDLVFARPSANTMCADYLCLCANSFIVKRQIHSGQTGLAQKHFNVGAFKKTSIPLPSLPEQKAIAGVLECWDKTIRGVERKIEKKRQVKKGLMQQLLTGTRRLPEFGAAKGAQGRRVEGKNSEGWRGVRLGVIAAIRKGRQLNRLDQAETGEYPVLNGGVQPLGYAGKWNTAANTICVSEGGNSCGFVSLITTRFWCGGHCYALKEDASQVDKSFLHQQLKFRQAAIMRLRVGSGLPNIQKKALEKFHLKVPRIEEQRAIAAILSSADEEIEGLERKLANLKEQKRFLLNNLVTGAIRLPRFAKRRKGAVKGVRR